MAQTGFKRESAHAGGGVPDTFYDTKTTGGSAPVYADRMTMRADRQTALTKVLVGFRYTGSVDQDLVNKPMASLLKDMIGAPTGSGPLTYTPGSPDSSFVWQWVPVDSSNTNRPRTDWGCKIDKWSLKATVGEVCKLHFDYSAKKRSFYRVVTDGVTTNGSATITSATSVWTKHDIGKPITGTGIPAGTTIRSFSSATSATLSANATASGTGVTFTIGVAMASASYTAGMAPFSCVDACLQLAGSQLPCKGFTVDVDKHLDNDRGVVCDYYPLEQKRGPDAWTISGSIDHWFDSDAIEILAENGNEAALVATFSNGTESLVLTLNVQIMGDPTPMDTVGVQTQSTKWEAGSSSSDAAALTAVLTNGETSAP